MFNHDIRRAFARANTAPTQAFKDRLKARIVPDTAPRYFAHPFRAFALAGASLALVLGIATAFSPSNVNRVLAESIQNTFSFRADGFNHLKFAFSMDTPGSTASWTEELWSDGLHALSEHVFEDGRFGLSLYDVEKNLSCGKGAYQEYEPCNMITDVGGEAYGFSATRSAGTQNMDIVGVNIEYATDTHGDLYFSWITNEPLSNVTYIDTSDGPYGYISRTWNATYSWQNDSGQTVNRVTWFSENMTQSPFDEDTRSFLVQIQEIAPEDVGSYGAFQGSYVSQSPVYRIDLDAMTVTPVTDEWLEASRVEFDAKLISKNASTEALAREYEQAFSYALDIGAQLDDYTLIDREITETDGVTLEVVTYELGNEHPIIINVVQATRVEFVRETEKNIIRDMKLFSEAGTVIYHAELLIFEVADTAPENFFSVEAWNERASTVR
jgi:hypothetical protein